jgi:putative transposase
MRRTNTSALAPSTSQNQRLLVIADGCARLWNEITHRRRKALCSGKIDWAWSDLYDKYKGLVGSTTAQQIERKNNGACGRFFALLRMKKEKALPTNNSWYGAIQRRLYLQSIIQGELQNRDYST